MGTARTLTSMRRNQGVIGKGRVSPFGNPDREAVRSDPTTTEVRITQPRPCYACHTMIPPGPARMDRRGRTRHHTCPRI